MSVARRAHSYPQVTLTAADLVDTPVISAPSSITVSDALRLSRRRHARVLACGAGTHVLTDDLARAAALGLGDLGAAEVERPLPVVEAEAPELRVRRAPDDDELAVLNERFSELCKRGRIERSEPLSVEMKEGDSLDLQRIRFTFARHGFAQLRGLIDALNDLPV